MIAPLAALASADRWLLLKINRDWTHPLLDAAMPILTDVDRAPWFLFGAAPAAAALWLWKGKKQALKVAIVAALAVGSADLLAHRVIKPWAARPRPARAGSAARQWLRAPPKGPTVARPRAPPPASQMPAVLPAVRRPPP